MGDNQNNFLLSPRHENCYKDFYGSRLYNNVGLELVISDELFLF